MLSDPLLMRDLLPSSGSSCNCRAPVNVSVHNLSLCGSARVAAVNQVLDFILMKRLTVVFNLLSFTKRSQLEARDVLTVSGFFIVGREQSWNMKHLLMGTWQQRPI